MRSKVDTADVFWIVRFSIAVNVGVIVPPINVADRVSVPVAPLSVSAEPNVAKLPPEPPKEPSKLSLPEAPVKVFALVVSVLNWFPKKFNKNRHLACSHGLVFCVPPPFFDQNASKQGVERQ